MEKLNRDCLENIFRYFSLRERLNLERVSNQWKDIMPYHDCHAPALDILSLIKWKSHQIVQVRHGPCGYCDKDVITYVSQAYLLKALTFFLCRFGKSLKNVTFNSNCSLACLVTPEILNVIPTLCINATSLDLTRCLVMDSALKILSEKYRLRSLVINYCTFIDSDQCAPIDGCLLIQEAITKSAKTLQVLDLRGIKGARLQFRNDPVNGALRKVILVDCYVTSSDLDTLIAGNDQIRHLEITSCLSALRFDGIANLTQLSQLIMRQSMITVSDFESICKNCKNIDRLHLEMCPRLTDLSALKEIRASLRQLSIIGRSLFIGDHVLEELVANGGVIQSIEILDSVASNEAFRKMVPFARGVKITVRGTGISDATVDALQECGNTVIRMGYL